jgi:hypothetical protein
MDDYRYFDSINAAMGFIKGRTDDAGLEFHKVFAAADLQHILTIHAYYDNGVLAVNHKVNDTLLQRHLDASKPLDKRTLEFVELEVALLRNNHSHSHIYVGAMAAVEEKIKELKGRSVRGC